MFVSLLKSRDLMFIVRSVIGLNKQSVPEALTSDPHNTLPLCPFSFKKWYLIQTIFGPNILEISRQRTPGISRKEQSRTPLGQKRQEIQVGVACLV